MTVKNNTYTRMRKLFIAELFIRVESPGNGILTNSLMRKSIRLIVEKHRTKSLFFITVT